MSRTYNAEKLQEVAQTVKGILEHDSGGENRPVSDNIQAQQEKFRELRKRFYS